APYFFFFSTRRRHTSFSRDWSSDVCSSDLSTARDPSRAAGSTALGEIVQGLGGGLARHKAELLFQTPVAENRAVLQEPDLRRAEIGRASCREGVTGVRGAGARRGKQALPWS